MAKEKKKNITSAGAQRSSICESRLYAEACKNLTVKQRKILIYLLSWLDQYSKIEFKELSYVSITVGKKELAEAIGIKADKNMHTRLNKELEDLPGNSQTKYYKNGRWYKSDILITKVEEKQKRGKITFQFQGDALRFFFGIQRSYIRLGTKDFLSLRSVNSMVLYEYLMCHSNTRQQLNSKRLSTKALKDLLGMKKSDYVYKWKGENGTQYEHFNRTLFEKKVIDPIVKDLKNCSYLKLTAFEKKHDAKGGVSGYEFQFRYNYRPIPKKTDAKPLIPAQHVEVDIKKKGS